MTAELLVNVTPSETRVAYIDGGILQEIHIEREARRGIVGNIYKGRVSRVLPGMQAAFVDIGLVKPRFFMHPTSCRTPNVWRVKNKSIHGARHLGTGSSGARSDGAGGERSAWH